MRASLSFLLVVAAAALLPTTPDALKEGFYKKSCPSVESLVKQAVASAFAKDQGVAAGLIRIHFHDCFVRGCDASVLLEGNNTERTSPPNLTLRGIEVIHEAKSAVESACPAVVSCADIIAFAARDSAELSGNITWKVQAGRRDGSVSVAGEALANLPSPNSTAQELIDGFQKKNLTADEMVTLSGAHSIGIAHCAAFTNRLYNFPGSSDGVDPSLSSAYASLLKDRCPSANIPLTDPTNIKLDIITPDVLDNKYYVAVQNNLGLLTSDHALMTDPSLAESVKNNAENVNGFANRFKRAMVKMGAIDVLEGTQGEIRKNCRVVNTPSIGFRGRGSGWVSQ